MWGGEHPGRKLVRLLKVGVLLLHKLSNSVDI